MLIQEVEELVKSCAVGAVSINSKQSITFWSKEAERLTGLAASQALGRPCWEVFAGKDGRGRCLCQQGCKVLLRAEFDTRVSPFNMLIEIKGGQTRWVNVMNLVVASPRGTTATLFHLLQDISKLKQFESFAWQFVEAASKLPTPSEGSPFAIQIQALQNGASRSRKDDLAMEDEVLVDELATQLDSETIGAALSRKDLTPREREVLKLLSQGADTAAIAEKLVISQATVRNHVQHIISKLGVRSRLEAAIMALSDLGRVSF